MATEKREHVEHYAGTEIETIDFIFDKLGFEGGLAYILGNILKYASRLFYKGQARSDMEKILNYARIALEKWDEHDAREEEASKSHTPMGFTIPTKED